MTKTEKIVVVSAGVVTVSTVTMLMLAKKYDAAANQVLNELQDIQYTLSRSREDILVGNREIIEGNKILRDLVKQSVTDLVEET